jgi:hypothetical protein
LKRQFHARFGDSSIAALTDNAAYRYSVGNQAGTPEFRNLFSDFFVGEPGSATAWSSKENKQEKERESPVHQGFESSTP